MALHQVAVKASAEHHAEGRRSSLPTPAELCRSLRAPRISETQLTVTIAVLGSVGFSLAGVAATRLILEAEEKTATSIVHEDIDAELPLAIGVPLPVGEAQPLARFAHDSDHRAYRLSDKVGGESSSKLMYASVVHGPGTEHGAKIEQTWPNDNVVDSVEQNVPTDQATIQSTQERDPSKVAERLEHDLYGARVRYVIQRYYARHAASCFPKANTVYTGQTLLRLRIAADGNIEQSSIADANKVHDPIATCLVAQARNWRLPPPTHSPLELQVPMYRVR